MIKIPSVKIWSSILNKHLNFKIPKIPKSQITKKKKPFKAAHIKNLPSCKSNCPFNPTYQKLIGFKKPGFSKMQDSELKNLKLSPLTSSVAPHKYTTTKLDLEERMREAKSAYEQMREVQELLNQAYQDLKKI